MYNFDDSVPSKPVSSYMDVGIHENVKLDKWEYKVSTNGNKFLALYFKNKAGEELSHTEWEPSDPDSTKLQSKVFNQMTRFRYIIEALVPGREFKFSASDFESFCNNIISILSGNDLGLVRVKVIYNNLNYTSLPRYIGSTWIESMSIDKDESRIKISSSDKMTKTEKDPNSLYMDNVNPIELETIPLDSMHMNDSAPF